MPSRIDARRFRSISRRELLKLTPVLALGAFAIPKLQEPLLKLPEMPLSHWRIIAAGGRTFAWARVLSPEQRLATTCVRLRAESLR